MSMTYWLMSEHDTHNHEDDLHGLYYFQLNLDALCEKLGITPLSEYLDDSELREAWLEDEDNHDLLAEAGVSKEELLEPAVWHDPAELLVVLEALERQIKTAPDSLYETARDDDFTDDFKEDDDGCDCGHEHEHDYDDDDEDADDVIKLTPELVLADIAALKPVLQDAIESGEKVHLRMLG